ncbi:MAG: methyltransferase domain-containing protein [Planctomycetota bacterium]
MQSEQALAGAYRSRSVAEEYGSRHKGSMIRRIVSRREAGILASLFYDLPEGALLLDAACGIGRHSPGLAKRGWKTISLDASFEMILRGCLENSLRPGSVVNGSVFDLPFRNKSLDGCACMRFLHHLPDAGQRCAVLKEFSRVAKGPVVISFWTGFSVQSLRRRLKQLMGRRPSARYRIKRSELKDELLKAGLVLGRIRYLHRFFSETAYARLLPVEKG